MFLALSVLNSSRMTTLAFTSYICVCACARVCTCLCERESERENKKWNKIFDQLVFNCVLHFPNSALYNVTGLDVRVRKIEPHVERDFDEGSA